MKHCDCDTLYAEMQHFTFYSSLVYQGIYKQRRNLILGSTKVIAVLQIPENN